MVDMLQKWHQSLKDFLVNIVLRKILIPVVLTLVYVLGIGFFGLLARVFARQMLNQKSLKDESFWMKTHGHEPSPEKLLRQS